MFNLSLPMIISRIIVLVVSFTVHEFSHAWSAVSLGDDTPRINGRLTLNPLAHLDIFGSLLLLVAGFGWAKPVPINPYALQRRTSAGVMLVSLAGPMSNFIMAILAAVPLRMGLGSVPISLPVFLPSPQTVLFDFIWINLTLMLFNLIPLAPLDGDKIIDYFLPPSWAQRMDRIRPYGPIILMAFVFVGPLVGLNILGWIMTGPITKLFTLLVG